jgi:hypothetical protein
MPNDQRCGAGAIGAGAGAGAGALGAMGAEAPPDDGDVWCTT